MRTLDRHNLSGGRVPEVTTVLITDMEGSTAYTQAQGDEVAMGLLRTHENIVRDVVSTHGGREIKSMGDGFMIAFSRATDGVACALDIVDVLAEHNATNPSEPILVRLGLNTGPVIEEGGDLYGTTVNAASRIAAKARSGQVLVSEETRAVADPEGWKYVDRGLFWLKGLRERWRLVEATRAADVPHHGPVFESRSPFVDRDDERAALRLYVDAALDGRGGLVMLAGEPGAGKTRLAEEVGAEAAGRGMRLVVGRCYEASKGHPFAPFVDVLEAVEREASPLQFRVILGEVAGEIARLLPHIRRRYPDIPPPAELPPEQERHYLFASVREVLAGMARDRPLFLHLDDLHWADEPSLLFLEQLAPDLGDLPILVVGTYTQPELAASPPLLSAIEKMQRRRVMERFTIAPLSEDDVASLLARLGNSEAPAELVRSLYRETEGNPFFVEELVRHLDDQGRLFDASGGWRTETDGALLSVPETVRLTIGRRLEGLDDVTRRVLTTAAVIGRDFGFDLLEELADANEDELLDALDEAERTNAITSTSEGGIVRFRFAHELTRQTLIGDVSLTRRQLLHLRIADAMERVYASSLAEHASGIAYHLTEAGRRATPERTVRFLVLAGERALEAAAYPEAARHLDRAMLLTSPDDLATRAPILETLAMAERSLGQPEDAIATWNEALDAYETLGDPETVARLCMDAGIQVAWWARTGDARRLVARGLSALGERETAHRAGLIALDAIVAGNDGDYVRAEELLDQAVTIARRHADDRVLGRVLYSKAAHHFTFLQHEQAVEFGSESIDHLRRSGDLWNLTNVLGFVGQSLGFVGRFQEAADVTEDAKQLAERLGNWVAYIYIDRARAWRHLAHNPDPKRLEADGQRDLELGNKLGYRWMSAVGFTRMSFASFMMGRWDEAIARANEASTREAGPLQGHLGRLVLLHAYRGDKQEALGCYEQLRQWELPAAGTPSRFGVLNAYLAALEGLSLIGEDEEAARLYPWAVEATSPGMRLFRGWDYRLYMTLAGIGATCARQYDQAEEHFHEAIRLAEELPYVLEQPEAYRFYARMLVERDGPGDREQADRLLTEAIAAYRALGMPKHEELTNAMRAQIA